MTANMSAALLHWCIVAGLAMVLVACGAAPAAAPNEAPAMDHSAHQTDPEIPFDLAFLDDMTTHHEGAIAMAEELLAETSRPELLELASGIIEAQKSEVEQMVRWRSEWYPDAAPSSGTGMELGAMSVSEDASVPYDQRFLQAMIDHHQGAIGMAEMAAQQTERDEIRKLAGSITSAQQSEIAQMQKWLSEWFGQ
jgi:uncharacterized protein (DUF305 family)